MKVTIESTKKIVVLKQGPFGDGIKARVWEGTSESGIKVICLVSRVSIPDDEQEKAEQFKKELIECKAPSVDVEAIPFRLILD